MKKLLALLGAVGMVATSSAAVISCNDVASLEGYSDTIENNLYTEVVNVPLGNGGANQVTQWDMANYFSTIGTLDINTANDDDLLKLTNDILKLAVEQAVDAVVSAGANDTDYTVEITDLASPKTGTNDDGTANSYIAINIKSKDGSANWRGKTEIDITLGEISKEADSMIFNGGNK